MKKSLVLAAIFAALAITACGKKETPPVEAPKTEAPAPAPAPAAPAPAASDAAATPAPAASEPAKK